MFRAEFARHWRRNTALIAIFTAWLALMAWGLIALPGTAHAAPADRAPECVTIAVQLPQPDGSLHWMRLEFCGNHPGGDSALHDWVAGKTFTLDGATAISRGQCGGRADPCVIFGP